MTLTKRDLVIQIAEAINWEQEILEKENLKQQYLEQSKQAKNKQPTKQPKKRFELVSLSQQQVLDIVQRTLDGITGALAKGYKVELRNFGVFEVKVRKARTGRNPNTPKTEIPIPERSVVKFKSGKEMRAEVLKLPTKLPSRASGQRRKK